MNAFNFKKILEKIKILIFMEQNFISNENLNDLQLQEEFSSIEKELKKTGVNLDNSISNFN